MDFVPLTEQEYNKAIESGFSQEDIIAFEKQRESGASPQGGSEYLSDTPIPEEKSPLRLNERLRLSFADPDTRKAILQKEYKFVEELPNGKLAVGNDIRALQPIDPEGFMNDVLGDIVDVSNSILPIASQISLATAGSVLGPGGTVGGGAVGAGVGEAGNIAIGKLLGVRNDSPESQATDIAISTFFGGAGETIGQVAKYTGKNIIAPRLSKLLDNAVKKTPRIDPTTGAVIDVDQSPVVEGMAKLFKFTAAVDEKATRDAAKHGFANTFTKENADPRTIISIADDVRKAAHDETLRLGREVGRYTDTIIDRANKIGPASHIPVDDLAASLRQSAEDLGVLDSLGNVNKNYPNTADIKPITSLLRELGDVQNGRYVVKPGKTVPVEKAIQLSRSFGQKFESVNPKVQNAFKSVLGGDEELVGLRERLVKFADSINLKEYGNANREFSGFKKLLSGLKQIEHDNPATTETFLKNLENKALNTQDALSLLQSRVPSIKFLDRLEKFNAAQSFSSANPNFLRLGTVASLVGTQFLPFGGDDPASRAAKLAGGLALGTPAGLRTVLKTSSKLGTAAKASGKFATPNESTQKLLRAILSRQGVESNKGKDKK